MSTLEPTSFLFEIAEHQPIPLGKLAYFQARLRYNLYDYIVKKFKEMEREQGLTKAELARRIGCKPEQITRRLGAPGNWTLDTISDLLIGIAGEELEPRSISVLDREKRNSTEKSWREPCNIMRTQTSRNSPSTIQNKSTAASRSAIGSQSTNGTGLLGRGQLTMEKRT